MREIKNAYAFFISHFFIKKYIDKKSQRGYNGIYANNILCIIFHNNYST